MPHIECSPSELERLYPPIQAPPENQLDDLHDDSRDGVYQHGLEIAEEIRQQTSEQGRRRRPSEVPRESQGDAPEAPVSPARATAPRGGSHGPGPGSCAPASSKPVSTVTGGCGPGPGPYLSTPRDPSETTRGQVPGPGMRHSSLRGSGRGAAAASEVNFLEDGNGTGSGTGGGKVVGHGEARSSRRRRGPAICNRG